MGFQNKFYNASKKNAGQSSSSAAEYRINVSSDTPHWYIRDYLARVSRHYDISAVDVDGNTEEEALFSAFASEFLRLLVRLLFLMQIWMSVRHGRLCVSNLPFALTPMVATGVFVTALQMWMKHSPAY